MKDKELEYLIKELEKDIDNYCGDYGTLEGRLENTLYRILVIIKRISGGNKEWIEKNKDVKVFKEF